jgi:putative ABC transport system permease protein
MSLLSRIANVFRNERLTRELNEELESHLAEAVEKGRDAAEARRAFGSAVRLREESRDVKLVTWLDSLRADVVFGWRQLMKSKVSSAAAVLSLAVAMGACTAAFRLIDALLLRPLPVAQPERLHLMTRHGTSLNGTPNVDDSSSYPMFRLMRDAVKGKAELIAASYASRTDLTYGSDEEMEKAHFQYVSGWMFQEFGLKPALGRLFTEADDRTPGAHPYAVISHNYWVQRFGKEPNIIGRTVRIGKNLYEIVGVVEEKFTGTEPGTMVDLYVPAMMNSSVTRSDSSWFRTLVRLEPGADARIVQTQMHAVAHAFEQERAKGWEEPLRKLVASMVLRIEPAPSGVSGMQRNYRVALTMLGVLVGLVLLIACVNVANLMTARATARAREMALRVAIGAGRKRLLQLVLVESAWVALLASMLGGLFAYWAAPFVVGLINPPHNPARLYLPVDWRLFVFALLLTFTVTLLFGLLPALRASGVKPAAALKGGEDPHARRRLIHGMIAAQVAFCFLVLFVTGLFVSTYDQLAKQPTGFSSERLLVLQTVAAQPTLPTAWEQLADHLRTVPGVEKVGLADHALMDGYSWNGFVSLNGAPSSSTLTFYRAISPGWLGVMKIPLIAGRDFLPDDRRPGVAIVNETFAKTYFNGENPVGKWFAGGPKERPVQIVGLIRDERYRNMREPMLPQAFFPMNGVDDKGAPEPRSEAAFLVRTKSADPLAMAQTVRREVARAAPGVRVSNTRTQQDLVEMHTVRERLLAMLAVFFSVVALALSGVGLFGVLDRAVLQRRREIGIRMAIGAPAMAVVRSVTTPALVMVVLGAVAGLLIGSAVETYLEALLFGVKGSDPAAMAAPVVALLVAAVLASVPPAVRAVRTDPVQSLRTE